ncbi:MAG: hypothetical protein PHI90_09310, partial [Clostridia bacterium]|nr:hypothetical protein [Clostridia bacterium]
GGSGTFWSSAKELQYGSTLRNRKINGEWVGYISSPYVVFYGCNTANGEFAQNFTNSQKVTTYAQTTYASFSYSKKSRLRRINTNGTSLNIYLLSFESLYGIKNSDVLGKVFNPK